MRHVLLSSFILLPSSFCFAAPPSADYRLLFADEFNGTTLDTTKWSAASPGWTMPNSTSTASASMVSVSGGLLTLSAARNGTTSSFTSGSVSSYQKFNYAGGYVEARILLPNTAGSWPAFWGLYTGWPPEADIMEYPLTTNGGTSGLQNNQYNTAFHYTNTTGGNSSGAGVVTRGSDLRNSYHTFGMDWITNTSVAFYFDGAQVASFTNAAVSQMANMYMILDYAIGGWPGTPSLTQWPAGLTDQMKVDYVRVYQKDPGDPTSNWNINGDGSWDSSANWSSAGIPRFSNQVAYFGRVGIAAASTVSLGSARVVGGLTFDGSASGTTAYTIGPSPSPLQLASTTGSATIQATAASTTSQTISTRLEIWSNTTVTNNMTNGSLLSLNGQLSGAGSLLIDGPGTVVVSGPNGTYTGGTTIDAGAAGPAVLRVNASEALGTGTVTIGPVGNSTTARLELDGSRTLSNPIDLRGRNTATLAIQSTRGDNTLAGTVTLGVGGSNYWLQSDAACTLTLSNPTSLTSAAFGVRNVTLQGAGTGWITGAITNGSAILAITKDGAGTWTLSGANSYTGTTTITAGMLVLRPPAWTPVLTSPGGGDVQTQGRLVFDYTGTTSPSAAINTALHNGTVHSSTADANHALGYYDDPTASTVTLLYTLTGDANLDGTLNADDYALIDKGFSSHGAYWWQGDFNYDGAVTSADYLLIDSTYLQQQGGTPFPAFLAQRESQFGAIYVSQLLAAVPEPSSFLAACGLALPPLLRRACRQ